jgi:mono/diheme cytochrome c family protein
MLRISLVAVLLTAIASTTNAEDLPTLDKAAAEKISYRADVWPILKRHCWGCHSGGDAKGGLSVDTVADMLEGGDGGALFKAGKPDESLMLQMITGDEPEMPQKQPPLSAAKIQILRQWIVAGAKDDSTPGDVKRAVHIPATYRFAPAVTGVAFGPDGKTLAVACRSEVVLVDLVGEQAPRRLPTESDLLSHIEFSPDGKILAAVGGSPAHYGEVRFFNSADGAVVSSRRVSHDTLFRGGFAPDNKAIAVGGADGAAHVIPVDPKGEVRSFDLHSDWVMDVAYTADGKMLVTGGRDKATKVCSIETGKLLRSVDGSTELISSVAADAQFAIGAGKARIPISYELKIALSGVEVSGAGNGSKPVSKRAQYAKNFETQPGEILDMATSGDRKLVAIGGAYGDVRVYNIADRQRTALISNVPAPIYGVALNADGTRLAIGSKKGEVQIYELPGGKLVKSLVPVPVAPAAETVTAQ